MFIQHPSHLFWNNFISMLTKYPNKYWNDVVSTLCACSETYLSLTLHKSYFIAPEVLHHTKSVNVLMGIVRYIYTSHVRLLKLHINTSNSAFLYLFSVIRCIERNLKIIFILQKIHLAGILEIFSSHTFQNLVIQLLFWIYTRISWYNNFHRFNWCVNSSESLKHTNIKPFGLYLVYEWFVSIYISIKSQKLNSFQYYSNKSM